jgi:hypothetical protein
MSSAGTKTWLTLMQHRSSRIRMELNEPPEIASDDLYTIIFLIFMWIVKCLMNVFIYIYIYICVSNVLGSKIFLDSYDCLLICFAVMICV